MVLPEYLRVGQIVTTHGLRGDVRVRLTTDYPEIRFATGASLIVTHRQQVKPLTVTVERGRPHKNLYLVKFSSWNHIDEARVWIGGELVVQSDQAIPSDIERQEYYYHELIGCRVSTTDGEHLGVICEILPNPANDIWVVQRSNDKKLYLPFIKSVVKRVDIAEQQVLIEWMEGLD